MVSHVAEPLLLLFSCGLVRPALCLAASNIWLPLFCLCEQLWCSLMTALLWCAVGRACTQTCCQLWLMQLLAGLGMLGAAGPQGNAEAEQAGRWKVSELALINIWLIGLRKAWESDICQHSVFCRELPWTPTPPAHSQKARKSFTLLFLCWISEQWTKHASPWWVGTQPPYNPPVYKWDMHNLLKMEILLNRVK